MKYFFLILLLASSSLYASVEINRYKRYSWNKSWNDSINSELDQKENAFMLTEPLDEIDLAELGCLGFNSVTDTDLKKDFWVVFFSSLTRAESAFNPIVKSRAPKGGFGNYGLVQLSRQTARAQCGLTTTEEIADPDAQLRCGVKLMSWQLKGAPTASGKLRRPDLKDQLFGKHILLWGPLRQNDRRGRGLLVGWFKKHLDQMPFCKAS